MTSEEGVPITSHFSKSIKQGDVDVLLHLFIVEFSNAIFVSVYDGIPKLGSFSQGYSLEGVGQTTIVFQGKQSQFADALAAIFAKKTGKIVYGSVNIKQDEGISLGILKELIDQHFSTLI